MADVDAIDRDAQAAQRLASKWSKLDPLPPVKKPRPEQFPFDAMGQVLGDAALAISNDVQAPDALAGGSVLAVASLAAMPHADVLLPHGQHSPLSLFIVSGLDSGDRKSAVDAVALNEVEQVRRQQARQYLREVAAAVGDKDAQKPTPRSLTIGKATVEGLQHMLRGQSSVGLFTAEGGELLFGHSMREERRSAGLAWLLKAWGGETLDSLTRGDGLSLLLGRRVAMHCLVQPVLLRSLLADPLAKGQGLLARCLIAQPDTLAGTRLFNGADPLKNVAVQRFGAAVKALLERRPTLVADGDGHELSPRPVPLSSAARDLWIEFHDAVEVAQAPGGKLEHARAFASKAAEHAARIAAVIQMLADPDSATVSDAAMDGAMRVCRFYLSEHVRLTCTGADERRLQQITMLAEWMQARGRFVPHKDVLQRSPHSIRILRAEGIQPMLDELVERGYIRRVSDAWELRP